MVQVQTVVLSFIAIFLGAVLIGPLNDVVASANTSSSATAGTIVSNLVTFFAIGLLLVGLGGLGVGFGGLGGGRRR